MNHSKELGELFSELGSDRSGLSSEQANRSLEANGRNVLQEEKKKSLILVFLSQFKDLLVLILIISAILSFFTDNADSAAVILCVLLMNAIIGTVQTVKAEKSLAALKAMSSPSARVMRDGCVTEIAACDICVGDVLLLEAGDIAPADARIIESASLRSDESSLTGESTAVEKKEGVLPENIPLGDCTNMVFSGSKITNGRCTALVTSTGMNTEIGKIAAMLNSTKAKATPLQQELNKFSRILSIAVIAVCAIVMALSLIRGEELANAMMFAVALAVAAIPEALGSIVTISLAIGTRKISEQNAIVKDLKAVESLGCVNVICSDKTGTLTKNRMTVREIYGDEEMLREAMILCCDASFGAEGTIGDPTETALIEYCGKDETLALRSKHKRISENPFDSDRKMMSVLSAFDGGSTMFIKGASDIMLERLKGIRKNGEVLPVNDEDIAAILEQNRGYSDKGMRVLCFAYRDMQSASEIAFDDERDMIFIGLTAMTDPPRDESKAAVADCISAGIKPVMITGDHKATATAIAKEIGIFRDGDIALDGTEIDAMTDEELTVNLPRISVCARVNPSHKIRIVDLWQKLNKVVAMTGDGVNDAPALKKSDVGVAMGITGTQVSKDAADVVLTDDNFATIIKAVANGRTIYRNIKNSIKFLLMGNFAGILAVVFCIAFGLPMPFSPVHLLFINLLTDSLPALAISTEKPERDVLKHKPRSSNESILNKKSFVSIALQGVILAAATIGGYFIGLSQSAAAASTMAFAILCLGRLFAGFGCRSDKPLSYIGIFSNRFSNIAFLSGAALLGAAILIPALNSIMDVCALQPVGYAVIVALAAIPSVIVQLVKLIMNREHS